MKKYSEKSSAVRAAKKQFGSEWETKAAVMLATDSEGWVIIERQEQPQNLTLAQALEESGETLESLKDDKPARKADALANRQALGWKLSSCKQPTKRVWEIAFSMPGASRKEVIAACMAAGIGEGTSRTQYQAWFSASKASGVNPRA